MSSALPVGHIDATEAQNAGGSSAPEYCWGVDPSTKRVAIAAAGSRPTVRTIEVPSTLRTGARLDWILGATYGLARELAEQCPPLYVWIEQPAAFGRQPEPELYYAVGVVQAAIYSALRDIWPHPVEVRTIPIGTWKKNSVGKGNATKEDVLWWSIDHGYTGTSEDEADAWAIAHAGRVLLG